MEPIILYLVLFLPGAFSQPETAAFSSVRVFGSTVIYTIPSLALLWYLITDKKGLPAMKWLKPQRKEFIPFFIGLPGLIIIGLLITILVLKLSEFFGFSPPPAVEGPFTIIGWFAMILSCLGTGYLEESYFRYYLLAKLEYMAPVSKVALSTALFSLCHYYEGPWGVLNAALAGILLSVLFLRFKSLHGIAWAHGVYNMVAYTMGNSGA